MATKRKIALQTDKFAFGKINFCKSKYYTMKLIYIIVIETFVTRYPFVWQSALGVKT